MSDKPVNEIRFNKHRRRKNNDIVAAMYAMYLQGPDGKLKSLAEVGKTYKKTRQAIYDVFKTRGYPLRSRKINKFQYFGDRKFAPTRFGYWRATEGDRKQMHVFVWESYNGPLPAGHGIHHKDLDRSNNKIENLECLTIEEISSKHNPHFNQFTSPIGSRMKKWQRQRLTRKQLLSKNANQ